VPERRDGQIKGCREVLGLVCSIDFRRIEANPNVAFASSPFVVVSGGTAKKAR